ncbi:MAG TPA: hypothetical protein VFX86_04645, partial [Candidatus Saccharimonadales bacterium]|nr:hypothetical protein [Candidatus Saccharimonadales bacterium]
KSGNVKLEQLQLGKQQLSVKKPAFAETYRQVTVGWGSNPIGDIGLIPVGSRYKFIVKDFVSGKPIVSAEAISGDASATANKKGEIVLVVADQNESEVNIKINAAGYRSEKIKLEVGSKGLHRINLAPAKKHAFVSKRSGKYDLYKIDIDGKNEEMILAGTGSESESTTVILPNKDNNLIAFVSTRGDQRDQDGYALSNLMIIDLTTGSVETIDHSQRLQLLSFAANELVYVRIAEGEEDDSPKRHQLISYDTDTKQQNTLAQANYFNDALVADGAIYYAPAKFGKNTKAGLFKVNPDGSNKTTVYDKETWSLFRVAYDKLNTAVGQDWFEYNLFSGTFNPLSGAPPDQQSRIYVADPLGDKSAWVDSRDGKGVLIVYDTASGQDTVIQTQGGLSNPISWLDNDHLVYRVTNSSETADYVISLSGGDPKKIRDVTNTAGLDRWYYY